jgi:branched-chain amino acid aminotransferase
MRVVALRNRGGIWQGPGDREFDLIALTADLKDWGRGVKLAVHPQARHAASPFRGTKSLSWSHNLAMLEEAQQAGYDETILLNERNEVSECTSANIFVAEGSRVWTPPLESGCLPGVTREILLGEVRAEGYAVGEKTLGLEELERAGEVFITSTTRELLQVLSVQGRPLRQEGGARIALQEAFSRYVEAYVAQHNSAHEPI